MNRGDERVFVAWWKGVVVKAVVVRGSVKRR
jgi:hypothetical protein